MEVILPLWAAIALLIVMAVFFSLWGLLLYLHQKKAAQKPPEEELKARSSS